MARLEAPDNRLLFSAASLWEIAIKTALGRSDFTVDPRRLRQGLIDNGYEKLTQTGAHALDCVGDFIENIYNRTRMQSALKYRSPMVLETYQLWTAILPLAAPTTTAVP